MLLDDVIVYALKTILFMAHLCKLFGTLVQIVTIFM